MINPEQIPDKVVEAAARAMEKADSHAYEYQQTSSWEHLAAAAILAGLKAWPGMHPSVVEQGPADLALILPLPIKETDA